MVGPCPAQGESAARARRLPSDGGRAALRRAERTARPVDGQICLKWMKAAAMAAAFVFVPSLGGKGAVAEVLPQLTEARYDAPTRHYPHAVLGDDVEYSALVLRDSAGTRYRVELPADGPVFEDLQPRLWDVTGDGRAEVVVVESHPTRGARLVVYGLTQTGLREIAATPNIGTRFRWLAPIGAADMDGDGHVEIAYIDRPHLARLLRVWRYSAGELTEVAQTSGLTNHRIGEDFITSGLRDCGDGVEIITLNPGWNRIIATRLVSDGLQSRDLGVFRADLGLGDVLSCTDPQ